MEGIRQQNPLQGSFVGSFGCNFGVYFLKCLGGVPHHLSTICVFL
jgi:hypothetical protein